VSSVKKEINRNNKGFTLIEVILAIMVISSGLFILTNSWSGTYNRLRKTQIQVQMTALLERKVAEIEREYKGKSLDSIDEEKEDKFGGEVSDAYSWRMESRKLEIPDLSANLTAQEGGVDQSMLTIMKVFTEHLSKSIKEVKISVINNELGKPLVADVTIYMIDYDRPINIPGIGGVTTGNSGSGTSGDGGGP
jgi:general secretion pathway protein I